jgi:hypothetical protein
MCMPNMRFTISTEPEIHSAIKAHADAAGIDVSAYVIAAAVTQMAADDAAAAVFAPLDADNATGDQAVDMAMRDLPAFEDLSPDEQTQIRRMVSSAVRSGDAHVA